MEADTKNKSRGRPTIISDTWRALFPDKQGRALTNFIYVTEAQELLTDKYGADTFKSIFIKGNGNYRYHSILEQIGRMSLQNKYGKSECIEITEAALKLLKMNWTVKQVAAWIRRGRTTGEW